MRSDLPSPHTRHIDNGNTVVHQTNARTVLKKVASFIVDAVSPFIPTSAHKICLISSPDISDNCYALYRHLSRSEGGECLRYVWLVSNAKKVKAFIAKNPDLSRLSSVTKIIKKRSLRGATEGLFHFLTSRHAFFTHGTYDFASIRGNRSLVNLWHGMALKKLGLLDKRPYSLAKATLTIATSPFFQSVMAAAFGLPREKVLVTGMPRTDLFHTNSRAVSQFLKKEQYRRTVIWMPTFRKTGAGYKIQDGTQEVLSISVLGRLNEKCRMANVLCIVKIHPFDHLNKMAVDNFTHIRIIKECDLTDAGLDIYEVLGEADRLITDYSSVFVDFALTGKPMGFYVPDEAEYTRGFIAEVHALGYPGAVLKTEESFFNFVTGDDLPDPVPEEILLKMNDYPRHQSACDNLIQALGIDAIMKRKLKP